MPTRSRDMTRLVELLSPLVHNPAAMAWPVGFVAMGLFIKNSLWLYIPFVLPGTLLHELSHLTVGWILRAKPSRFTVIPKLDGQELTLGSVGFNNLKWWNALPIGLAPLLLLPLAFLVITYAARYSLLSLESVGLGYLAAQCGMGCMPSATDLRHSGKSAAIYALLGIGAWYLHHVSTR